VTVTLYRLEMLATWHETEDVFSLPGETAAELADYWASEDLEVTHADGERTRYTLTPRDISVDETLSHAHRTTGVGLTVCALRLSGPEVRRDVLADAIGRYFTGLPALGGVLTFAHPVCAERRPPVADRRRRPALRIRRR
jgi:hypothetical protein